MMQKAVKAVLWFLVTPLIVTGAIIGVVLFGILIGVAGAIGLYEWMTD